MLRFFLEHREFLLQANFQVPTIQFSAVQTCFVQTFGPKLSKNQSFSLNFFEISSYVHSSIVHWEKLQNRNNNSSTIGGMRPNCKLFEIRTKVCRAEHLVFRASVERRDMVGAATKGSTEQLQSGQAYFHTLLLQSAMLRYGMVCIMLQLYILILQKQ